MAQNFISSPVRHHHHFTLRISSNYIVGTVVGDRNNDEPNVDTWVNIRENAGTELQRIVINGAGDLWRKAYVGEGKRAVGRFHFQSRLRSITAFCALVRRKSHM